ncbi:MAG TPA: 50S ribosomal protein L30 [Myxococcaceae bacterium]|jgi:large subunit ribosomal protein L30|nr:50S ribosomal protein L30 [Myxococcaceae bacterium]
MGLKIKLVKSFAGASERQLATIAGLGLTKFGQEKLLKDTPSIRGMVFKVQHLVHFEKVAEEPQAKARHKARRAVVRERARAAHEQQAKN